MVFYVPFHTITLNTFPETVEKQEVHVEKQKNGVGRCERCERLTRAQRARRKGAGFSLGGLDCVSTWSAVTCDWSNSTWSDE